jgi:plastocyanin
LEGNLGSPVYHGRGGGIFIAESHSVTLTGNLIQNNTGSTSQGNAGYGAGGGILIEESTVTLAGNTISHNTSSTGPGNLSYASGGGVYVFGSYSKVTVIENTISDNIASVRNEAWGGGLAFFGASTVNLVNNVIQGNTASAGYGQFGEGGGVYFSNGVITMTGNLVQDNIGSSGGYSYGWGGGVFIVNDYVEGEAVLNSNIIAGNHASTAYNGSGGGLYIEQASFSMVNNLVTGNDASDSGSGMAVVSSPEDLGRLLHNTFADNTGSGEGIFADGETRLVLTNTIIASHASTGVTATWATEVSLESTLWHGNGSNTGGSGVVTTHNDYTGDPAFVAPFTGDYHIAVSSAAIDKGIDAQVANDVDGQPRPNGAAPDLGADEYYLADVTTSAEKVAFAPQWFVTTDPDSGLSQSYLNQRYLIQFQHDVTSGLVVAVTDTLPAELTMESELHTPPMDFGQQGSALYWQTQQPLPPGQAAQIWLTTVSTQVTPLSTITNTAEVSAGTFHFDLQASSQVPLFPPLITAPGEGEICSGDLEVAGIAHPDTTVEIYENDVEKAATMADGSGAFTVTYGSPALGYSVVELTAIACMQGAPGQCSASSPPVTLTPPQSFICPQPSTWENTPATGPLAGQRLVYRFLDADGKFKGDDGVFNFVSPHQNSQVHLYRRSCEEMGTPPGLVEDVWLEIEEAGEVVAIYDPTSVDLPWYHFTIDMELTDVPRVAVFVLSCSPPLFDAGSLQAANTITFSTSAALSFDQEGTIFDVTQGFDPENPALHAVEGVTVTAMISMPAWGGWVPWPAYLYNGQANPQVTGEDGYYAFFSPPGMYYLQVDGGQDYQSWRSPVFPITTRPLHTNVPLTPVGQDLILPHITLTPNGPEPAAIAIAAGESVEWIVETSETALPEELIRLYDNPLIRLLSDLDPLGSLLGWDSGMLAPGRAYRRQFTQPGTYTYTDGAGHTGTVVVTGTSKVYLPIVFGGMP